MTATIGTSTNTNSEGNVIDAISVGGTTAVQLLPAQTLPPDGGEQPRITVWIYNSGNQDLWVRFYPASTDNIKKGIPVFAGTVKQMMKGSDIYTGEISGIMEGGAARDVYVTWI
jgi:hypothetical protein